MNENNNLNQSNNTIQNDVNTQQTVVPNNQQTVENTNVQQPTPNTNNVVNTPQAVSTPQQQPNVVEQPTQTQTPQPVAVQENMPQEKQGTFKYVVAFMFFIAFTGFVLFIPEVTKFVKSKMGNGTTGNEVPVISNGTLTCTKTSESDETDVKYNLDFTFENQKLLLSTYTITHESLNTEYISKKEAECNIMAENSKNVTGIETTCNNKQGILVITEEYTNKDIDKNNLTAYTEAGGTYPEFEYEENIYDIQTKLVKQGYDCSVSSVER